MSELQDDVFYSIIETKIKEELKNISSMRDGCVKKRDYPLAAELGDAKHSLQKALDIFFEDNKTMRDKP